MAATDTTARLPTTADNLTPAMRQYVEQKAQAGDALLLFRMGDFYELFYDDAKTAARVLGLTLTSRSGKGDNAIPLAGLPYHALESYLPKLVHAGFKVAISEQVEDPKTAKGVVKREIVRIVTPGTLTDDALLDQSEDNYLAAVCRSDAGCGLAWVELSTGAFWVQLLAESQLVDELTRIGPAELILPEVPIDKADPLAERLKVLVGGSEGDARLPVTRRTARVFDAYQAEQLLLKHFGVLTLDGFGFDAMDASLCAAAAIVDYLGETQKTSLQHILSVRRWTRSAYVQIDEATWRSLEIDRTIRGGAAVGSLVHAVDRTSSAMGARCLRRWLAAPLRRRDAIIERQDAVAAFLVDPHTLAEIRGTLRELADIERITARLGVGRASPRDLLSLGRTLLGVEEIGRTIECGMRSAECGIIEDDHTQLPSFLRHRAAVLGGLHDLAAYLTESLHPDAPIVLNEGGIIAPGYDEELDRLRGIGADGQTWLTEYQAREIERSGIPSLKVGFNNVFGYYIEITHTHRDRVPPDYVRKQTLKNAERYITDELKQYETEVLGAKEKAITREQELFDIIRQHAVQHIGQLQEIGAAVAELDAVAGFAHLADERRYVRPELTESNALDIREGRHPVLEQRLDAKFVPNDCILGNAEFGMRNSESEEESSAADSAFRIPNSALLMVLTGPNMAGKSTYIRQVALLTLLAQTGSFVPAASMQIGPVDRIFARVGASDEITRNQSTFMVEMAEAANILNNATEASLVIIDELGRGTSTFDGLSLAWAIAEHIATRLRCRALFATHYHELTQLAADVDTVANYNVAVREWEDQVVFLHRIVPGGTDRSYGVHVARLAGVPQSVIQRSQALLMQLEASRTSPTQLSTNSPKKKIDESQLMLFTDPAEDVIKELESTRIEELTPLQAMELIDRWRKRLL